VNSVPAKVNVCPKYLLALLAVMVNVVGFTVNVPLA
jgi:hypothetical protein